MKKLFILCLVLLGCEKEPMPEPEPQLFCYDCLLDYKTYEGYYSLGIDFCDMTEEKMQEIIDLNTWNTVNDPNYIILRCTKRE